MSLEGFSVSVENMAPSLGYLSRPDVLVLRPIQRIPSGRPNCSNRDGISSGGGLLSG